MLCDDWFKVSFLKSLDQLENINWPDDSYDSSLGSRVRGYCKLPLDRLSVEALRLLISQKIGLIHIVPIALDMLERDILSAGDLYDGDLLQAVSSVDDEFWLEHALLNNRLVELRFEVEILQETINELLPKLQKRNFV